jgi:AraC-like DNA-binding protein
MDEPWQPAFVQVEVRWGARHRWPPGARLVDYSVSQHALWLVREGGLRLRATGREYNLAAGDACLIPGGLKREIVARGGAAAGGADWLSVGLSVGLFGRVGLLREADAPLIWRPDVETAETMAAWMRQIIAVREAIPVEPGMQIKNVDLLGVPTQTRGLGAALITEGLGRALFGLCCRALDGEELLRRARRGTPDWLVTTLAQIARAPDTPIHELADLAGYSQAQFRRAFHAWVGMSPQEHATRLRLEEARRLLLTTDLVVGVVAERVGFQSLSYFTRLFKERFGVPPARYRRRAHRVDGPEPGPTP